MDNSTLNILDAIGSLLSGVASMIALVGILLALAETRRSRQQSAQLELQLQHEAEYRVYGYMLDVDRFFFENPEMRAYIYNGKPLPEKFDFENGGVEYDRLEAVAEMVIDLFDCIYTQTEDMSDDFRDMWRAYLGKTASKSELLCHFVKANAEWYDEPFIILLTTGVHPVEELTGEKRPAVFRRFFRSLFRMRKAQE